MDDKKNLIIPVQLDSISDAQIQNLIQIVTHTFQLIPCQDRKIAAVVNCESTQFSSPLETSSIKDWSLVFERNVFGPFAAISALLPLLRESKGRVVNVTNASGMTVLDYFM